MPRWMIATLIIDALVLLVALVRDPDIVSKIQDRASQAVAESYPSFPWAEVAKPVVTFGAIAAACFVIVGK